MRPRIELHTILLDIVGSSNVYFQPPPSIQMEYPCIVYRRDYAITNFADNRPWSRTKRYQITIIDQDPDSEIPDKVAELPMCSFNRFFTADNLNHDIYDLFF
jgi:hypothetical protein